jgi:hypothetical protein
MPHAVEGGAARAATGSSDAMNKLILVAAVALVAGCETAPPAAMGPSVLVLPGSTKTFEQFRGDDVECRNYAGTQVTGDSNISLQRRYDYAYQQCMYARGHQVPGSVRPYSSSTPPPPAGTPPPPPPAKS